MRRRFSVIFDGWSVRRQLIVGTLCFQLLLLVTAGAACLALFPSTLVLRSIVGDTFVRIATLNEALDVLSTKESSMAAILATSDELVGEAERAKYAEMNLRLATLMHRLESDTVQDKEHKELTEQVRSLGEMESLFDQQMLAGKKAEAEVVFVRGVHSQAESARGTIRSILKHEQAKATSHSLTQVQRNSLALVLVLSATALFVLLGAIAAFLLVKSVSHTYDQINELKMAQDGDYFLTSILQAPLATPSLRTDRLNIESVIIQYKSFQFKNREHRIGGDYCSAALVELRGRKYAAFINADAMGKSIQGAGGALIVGSIFRAIIERTELSNDAKSVYPERWIKNAFMEMQSVFKTFDCSMFASAIIGLIDERSGHLYYANAEHPLPVLLRGGKAGYIDASPVSYKLGMPRNGTLQVNMGRLRRGDILIIGSDGRDDLWLESNSGERLMNEDYQAFLRVSEESCGDVSKIAGILERRGKLADDLSLMRIEFSGEGGEESEYARSLLERADACIEQNDILKAAICLEELSSLRPSPKILYKASLLSHKAGRLEQSIDIGERLRMRDPHHYDNLFNLISSYKASGDTLRAKTLLEELDTSVDINSIYGERLKVLSLKLRKGDERSEEPSNEVVNPTHFSVLFTQPHTSLQTHLDLSNPGKSGF